MKSKMKLRLEDFTAIGLPILLFLMVYTGSHVFFYLVLLIGLLFINKPAVILPVYFVSSLNTTYFSLSSGMSAGRFIFILAFLSLIIKLLKNKNRVSNPTTPLAVVLIIYTFFSALLSITGNLEPFVLMLMNLLIFILLPYCIGFDLNKFYHYLSISYFACLISIAFYILQNGQELFVERFHDEEEVMNSNNLAMMCNQVGTLLFAMFLITKNIWSRAVSLLGFVIALMEIVILGTRSAFIALILSLVIGFVLYRREYSSNNKKSVRLIFLSLVILGGIVIYYLTSLDTPLMERFTAESVVESKGTNRLNLIDIIMSKIFPEHPLFGVGIGGRNILEAGKPFGLERPAHNIIIDPLSQLGIVGFLLYMCLLIPLFLKSFTITKKSAYPIVILPALLLCITSVINGIGEVVFYEKFFWNNLALCAFCICSKNSVANGSL